MRKPVKKKVAKRKSPKFRPIIHTGYLQRIYYNKRYRQMIPSAVETIKKFRRHHPFDAIAFSGSSGAAIAYPISYLMGIPLIHIRTRMGHYQGGLIEGIFNAKRYLIVDDFIENGTTMRRIINTIKKEISTRVKPVGIVLFSSDRLVKFGKLPVINVE